MERLFSSVKSLEVFHHLLHVLLRITILDVGKPAATHSDDDGHHQHEVFQVVVTSYWKRPEILLNSKEHDN